MLGLNEMLASVASDAVKNAVEQNVQTVDVVYPCAIAVSMLLLAVTFLVARCKKIALGPSPGRSFNHATLTLGVFLSVLVFNVALSTYSGTSVLGAFLGKVFDTLQMMLAGKETLPLAPEGLGSGHDGLVCYELFIYLVAPITTFFDIVTLFTDTTPRLKAMWRSILRDTYLITPLGEQTLALAKSICDKYEAKAEDGGDKDLTRKVNIVFTDCAKDEDVSCAGRAYDIGAICVCQTMEVLANGISKRHRIHAVLDGGDASDHARAASMSERLQRSGGNRSKDAAYVYLFSPLVSAGDLLPSRNEGGKGAPIRLVDWTRSLVESTLDRHPLFLLNPSPELASEINGANEGRDKTRDEGVDRGGGEVSWVPSPALRLQQKMLETESRRVVIVGAGHVGMEFLKAAIAYSRIGNIAFSFDVVDCAPDPQDGECCAARSSLRASAPELLAGETGDAVKFRCIDARSEQYERFLVRNAPTITYVFVALGDDAVTADTAIRTRRILERGILYDSVGQRDRENEYGGRCRAVIVAVVDDDGLGRELTKVSSADLSQRIDVVGSRESMFSFESMRAADQRETTYKTRSAHASKAHAKYKVFAFAKHMRGQLEPDIGALEIDWRLDFRKVLRLNKQCDTLSAILAYNDYCENSKMFTSDGDCNHEWLLRIEHNRWCVFARAEGLRTPTTEELQTYASVFWNDEDSYRSDEAGLHARLVPFDELPKAYERWREVCASKCEGGVENDENLDGDFQERNDKHIKVEP